MSSAVIQLLVLAGIAIFLILRLKSVLGTRDGYEPPARPVQPSESKSLRQAPLDVPPVVVGPDHDIIDNVPEGSDAARALAEMKKAEPSFHVGDFLRGARGAYEMILMAFQRGDLSQVEAFLAPDVAESFREGLKARTAQGLTVEATFVGIRDIGLTEARYNTGTHEAEVSVRFVGEMTLVVKNAAGEIVEGSVNEIRRQQDVWSFARKMGSNDPNWQLVATDE
ncbi:Tim44 domain-containing protein [Thioclava sp. BHET1]|nr:Tim44 domain-containing protein [Thioclava sp. BHET1]